MMNNGGGVSSMFILNISFGVVFEMSIIRSILFYFGTMTILKKNNIIIEIC